MRATDETQLDDKQKAMVERAKASKATMGVKIMRAPPPAVLEHALTKDVKNPDGTSEPAKITVAFGDNTTITIVRTSVDIKPDMCIWRGTVEGPEAQVTLMWWPNGKMAGTVQGRGRPHSIRHMGGRLYAMVEMSEDRMPQEHAPMRAAPAQRPDPARRSAREAGRRQQPEAQDGGAATARARAGGEAGQPRRPRKPPPQPRTSPST